MKKQKILITGTAGFIGFHLADRLIKEGKIVIGLDNINDYYDVNVKYGRLQQHGIKKSEIKYNKIIQSHTKPNYKFIKLNLEDRESIDNLFNAEKFDLVCNLAAQAGVRYSLVNPYAYINSNLVGYLNVLEASRQNNIKHFMYASSSSVYGANTKLPFSTADNVDHPVSLYAATKKSNELIAHSYSHLFKLPTTGLRFFTVYGPWGRPDMALFLFTKAILENKPINVFNKGKMIRDFTYIDDIVEGLVRVINNPPKEQPNLNSKDLNPSNSKAPYQVYNIGNNNPVNLMDFVKAIEKKLGKVAKKKFMPMQDGDVVATYADVTNLTKNLGYKPETSITEGIDKFINWYLEFFED